MKIYKTIEDPFINEIIIDKSKFITYLFPIKSEDDAKNYLSEIRKTHRDANHNCYAYVVGDNNQIQRASDDGEPQKTAGMPILDSILKNEIKDVLCIVTRYFGGIKLGAGGLIRAYSKSASEAIKYSSIVTFVDGIEFEFTINYNLIDVVDNYLKTKDHKLISKTFLDKVTYIITLPKEEIPDYSRF